MVMVDCLIDSYFEFVFINALLHYHHFAVPVVLCTFVLLEVCLGLNCLKSVVMY